MKKTALLKLVSIWNGLPNQFKQDTLLVFDPFKQKTFADNLYRLSAIDLIKKENHEIVINNNDCSLTQEDVDIINNNKLKLCTKKMYNLILLGNSIIEGISIAGNLLRYKGVLFMIPFKETPLYIPYEPIDMVFYGKTSLKRIKIFKYDTYFNFIN